MPKCENCGKEFDGNFCPACGTKAAPAQDGVALKNVTKMDLEFNLRVTENMAGKKCRIILLVVAIALMAVGAVLLSLELVFPSEEPDFFFVTLLFLLGIFFLVFALVFKPFMRKILRKNMQGKESTNEFVFTEGGYEVTTLLNDGTRSTASGGYNGFTEAKEYKDMWVLYINKATAFSLGKECMTAGTAEELSALLSRMTGARYKKCYKN